MRHPDEFVRCGVLRLPDLNLYFGRGIESGDLYLAPTSFSPDIPRAEVAGLIAEAEAAGEKIVCHSFGDIPMFRVQWLRRQEASPDVQDALNWIESILGNIPPPEFN
jgi:hypothetical protein